MDCLEGLVSWHLGRSMCSFTQTPADLNQKNVLEM